MMRAQRGGQPVCDQELVWAPDDDDPAECCLVQHVMVSHADDPRLGIILRTDDEGFVSVNVTNTSETPLEFEAGDALLALRPADLRFCSAHSKVPEEVWNGLSVEDAAVLSAYQATCERTSLGGKLKSHGNGGESRQSNSKSKSSGSVGPAYSTRPGADVERADGLQLNKGMSLQGQGGVSFDSECFGICDGDGVWSNEYQAAMVGHLGVSKKGSRKKKVCRSDQPAISVKVASQVKFEQRRRREDSAKKDGTSRRVCEERVEELRMLRELGRRDEWSRQRKLDERNEATRALVEKRALQGCLEARKAIDMPIKRLASLEDVLSGKYVIESISPDVWHRPDVVPSVVLYAGIGGVTEGSITRRNGKYIVTAVVVEASDRVLGVHKLNHPEVCCV
jgi:hypothetical protein